MWTTHWHLVRLSDISMFAFLILAASAWYGSALNAIVVENRQEGVANWFHDQENGPHHRSEADGFSTRISYFPGEVVEFKLSSFPRATSYKMILFRLGYYGGLGAREVGSVYMTNDAPVFRNGRNDSFEIALQPDCLFEENDRVVDCSNWKKSAEWTIPADAVSGVYVAQQIFDLPRKYFGTFIPFIVRKVSKSGVRTDSVLLKTADMTWQAYNRYGDYNVYRGTAPWSKQHTRAYKASYNRPYRNRMERPFGHSINFIFGAELPMIFWLEKHGYDVSYCASQDVETMHQDGTLLNYKAILSVGHDEYWTGAMKVAHEYARDHGVHLAFFSGNEVYWRTVWDEDTQKSKEQGGAFAVDTATGQKVPLEPRRVFVCRKETLDSVPSATPEEWTGTFRDPRFRPADPESLLTGQEFMVNGVRRDFMTVTAEDAELRFWRNATFARWGGQNKTMPNPVVYQSERDLLGYEWDAFPVHAGRHPGLIPLSTTNVQVTSFLLQNYGTTLKGSGVATHRMSLYRRYNYAPSVNQDSWTFKSACAVPVETRKVQPQSTSLVFGAGTVQWSWALSDLHDIEILRPKKELLEPNFEMRPDRDIQQATLNLFADMGLFPGSFVADMTPPLVLPVGSTDTFPPSSSITGVHKKGKPAAKAMAKEIVVEVSGTAQDDDRGGGTLAAVEVSADGGRTWAMATGRSQWKHTFVFDMVDSPFPRNLQFNTSSVGSDPHDAVRWLRKSLLQSNGMYCIPQETYWGLSWGGAKQQCGLLILSRAIDDSGWIEHADTLAGLCALRAPSEYKAREGAGKLARNVRIVKFVM